MNPQFSIIICTCNRAESLRQTLASLAEMHVPDSLHAELLVVDNGSTDHTAKVIRDFTAPALSFQPICEAQGGKCRALNTALRASRGEILLFTDDDVRVPPDWIEGMGGPLLHREADAVVGGVVLAPHLQRPWMTAENTSILATTEALNEHDPERMVGANMAFSAEVLSEVPMFDPELGPGGLGVEEETLFTRQLRRAGYRLTSAFDVAVEHHPDPSRLSRAAHLEAMRKLGRSVGYVDYHWRHWDEHHPSGRLREYGRMGRALVQLIYKRTRHRSELSSEGMPMWERRLLRSVYRIRQRLKERGRPRNYERFGMVKRDHDVCVPSSDSEE